MSTVVVKSDHVVFQQLALNKFWIPDVLIDIVKDYLYIDIYRAKQNFFKRKLKEFLSMVEFGVNAHPINGEYRWITSCIGIETYPDGQHYYHDRILSLHSSWTKIAEPDLCVTCGTLCSHHGNLCGICLRPGENDAEMAHYINHVYPFEIGLND
jgi:hypothetical protein